MEVKSPTEAKHPSNPNPVLKANLISKLFFWWLNPLFKIGHARRLEETDMYDLLQEDKSEHLSTLLQREWEKELQKKKPSLCRAMARSFGKPYAVMFFVVFLEEMIKIVQPVLMGGLIRYFSPDSTVSTTTAYMYALGVGVSAMLIALAHHPYFFRVTQIGMWLRVASCSLIYKKALRLSSEAFGETTTGQIVNLMSNDVSRFDQCVIFLPFLIIGPIQGIIVLVILWYELGPASLAGFAILVLLIPVQGFMAKLFTKLRRKTAALTDKRVGLMSEILAGMRVIKMYCWEHMFGDAVHNVRSSEMERILKCGYAKAVTYTSFFFSAKLIAFLTFMVYVVQGHSLQAERVFVPLALINPVRLSLTLFVSFAIQMISEVRVTFSRIEKFLMLEELTDKSSVVRSTDRPKPTECKITALNITAKWDKDLTSDTLKDISFEVRAGELLAVIGPVGSGKSSLLMALLAELPLSRGSIKLNGVVAYASQQPWVFSASVRDNIIFGQPFNNARYQRAVNAAALTKDLEMLQDGDMTLVGERGVSLSGGQKARISLARAVYFDGDIYFLDDPLSAVDPAVGRHIFDKCICGALKNKPRILITHQLQYLQAADKILILKEGSPMGLGTFNELADEGVDFASLLKRDDEDDGDDDDILSGSSAAVMSDSTLNYRIQDKLTIPTRQRTVSEGPERGNVCLSYGQNSQSATSISKSLDTEYLSVLMETSDITETLLSHSIKADSYLDDQVVEKQSGHLRKRKIIHKPVGALPKNGIKSVDSLPQTVGSLLSLESIDSDIKGEYVAPQQAEEERAAGSVTFKIYMQYFYKGAGVFGIIIFVLLNLLAQTSYIMADWWLSYWSNKEEFYQASLAEHNALLEAGYNQTNVTIIEVPSQTYLYIYTGITASVFIFSLLRALQTFYILVSASKFLHNSMFNSIIRCPISFFDNNPIGRILNRFAKDMGAVDELLPLTMYDFIQCALMILGIILVAGIVNPWVFLPTLPLAIMFVFIRRYYLSTSRNIKRLEATTRSPVFSLVNASLQGIHTLRAYGVQSTFMCEFDQHQNQHSKSWYLFLATSRWFAVRLDWLCAFFIMAVALCSVLAASVMNGGLVGLSLTYAIGLMGLFQWGVRQSAEVENQMTSVERIIEYSNLESEAPLDADKDKAPPGEWPANGMISAENASLRYSPEGADVLKQLNFSIKPKEKVGIVGRTGAGKSSLIAMLFRLTEPRGSIMIDDVDIKTIGLHDLRQKISIIPQDPVLFTGTIRRNLDPFHQHEDIDLWKSLEEVQLKAAVEELPGKLEFEISEGGANFSVGQRQLICLSRAILKRNQILIIDEATANVDLRTDALIQQTIREKFNACTVLTIAHRLNTIMDSDRVMVLSNGELVEFAEPYMLLEDKNSLFRDMVSQVGSTEFENLLEIAREAFNRQSLETPALPSVENKQPPGELNGNEKLSSSIDEEEVEFSNDENVESINNERDCSGPQVIVDAQENEPLMGKMDRSSETSLNVSV